MRLLLVNSVCGIRSTGRIVADIAKEYEAKGWEVKIAYGREPYVPEHCKRWAVRVGNWFDLHIHALITRLWGDHAIGLCSRRATKKFLRWANEYNPDLLWLHNIHGYYLNAELLFSWIKTRPEMKVKWTLHDCSAFTGRCSYFTMSGCEQWKSGCVKCPTPCGYKSYYVFGGAARTYNINKRTYLGVKYMTLITPSKWLADLTRQSFLREYPVEVVHNTIDLAIFKPTPSDFRARTGLADKILILGVASAWDRRKGLQDFLSLRCLLDENFVIVLVGLTDKQIAILPAGIVGIARTNSAKELAEIYSAADWFFNPTKEENYPTVNLEARACGCRIVTYDTGGCAETVEGYDRAWVLKGDDKTPSHFVKLLSDLKNRSMS